jgi:hypothetical protein
VLLAVGPVIVVLVGAGATELTAAEQRGDLDEVARLAGEAGAAGIGPMLASPDRAIALAGIEAAPAAPDAWELLADLAKLAGGWDRSLAEPAAITAQRIAQALDTDDAIAGDIPDDALEARQAAWSTLAGRVDRWGDVRVLALDVTAHLAATRRATADSNPAPGYELATVLGDADPEVRRAACELIPQPTPPALLPTLAAAVANDEDPAVALGCAQAVCADLAFDPPGPALAALGDAGVARVRTLLGDRKGPPDVPAGALVDAARCLAAHGTPEDRAALAALAAHAPRQAKRMIQHVEKHRP